MRVRSNSTTSHVLVVGCEKKHRFRVHFQRLLVLAVKLALSAVCDPVSPVLVTVDPAARSKSAVKETVNVLVAPDAGLLCRIDFRLKLGTTNVSGAEEHMDGFIVTDEFLSWAPAAGKIGRPRPSVCHPSCRKHGRITGPQAGLGRPRPSDSNPSCVAGRMPAKP